MLLDEPFGALDALTRIKMQSLLQRLCALHRPAVLLVTHDVDEAILLADRVTVLVDGQISLDVEVDIPRPVVVVTRNSSNCAIGCCANWRRRANRGTPSTLVSLAPRSRRGDEVSR